MFNLGAGELLVIALIALIVLGPERLPDAARTVGKVVGEVRKLSTGFQDEVRSAFTEPDEPVSARSRPNSSPLAAEVADLDEGRIDAVEAGTAAPGGAIEASATDVTGLPPGGAAPAELAPDVADALGEVLAGPRPEPRQEPGTDGAGRVDGLDGGEHRAAS
jgi:sec-independent protein translocase protein TatB